MKLWKFWISVVIFGIVAAIYIPTSANAAENPFIDVSVKDAHYESIVILINEGIVEGTSATTYEPYKQATRQEAALFIAKALHLDTVNVADPGFIDVPKASKYYGAIAALSQKGIIQGYQDGTFRPSNTLKRSQIAKMVTLGFGLQVSNNTTTPFKDVNVINDLETRQYIQTLIDYKITTGTTPETFSPFSPLTRGQLATFIKRALEATDGLGFQVISVE